MSTFHPLLAENPSIELNNMNDPEGNQTITQTTALLESEPLDTRYQTTLTELDDETNSPEADSGEIIQNTALRGAESATDNGIEESNDHDNIHQIVVQDTVETALLESEPIATDCESYLVKGKDFGYVPVDTSIAIANGYPKLDFKPWQIRTWFLIVTAIFWLCCIGGIVCIMTLAHISNHPFHTRTFAYSLAFRYGPSLVGTITTIWWRMILSSLGRIIPYVSMASKIKYGRDQARVSKSLENNYFNDPVFAMGNPMALKKLINNSHWLLLAAVIVQALMNLFLVPLKATFLRVVKDEIGWTITVSLEVGYALTLAYGILFSMTLGMIIRMGNRETGLRWDPSSIADQLALVQGSNILPLFRGLEFSHIEQCHAILKARSAYFGPLRLGYWRNPANEFWYGIASIPPPSGFANANRHKLAKESRAQIQLKYMNYPIAIGPATCNEAPIDANSRPITYPQAYRYRDVPMLFYDLVLAIFVSGLLTMIVLMITGLAKGRIQKGFSGIFSTWVLSKHNTYELGPQMASLEESVVFRFLPTWFFTLFSILWVNADHYYRILQPFEGMQKPGPATSNMLLDYPSSAPILITVKALSNSHWRVALFSLLSLVATLPPIVATGVFISSPTPNGFTISIEPLNFYACLTILILYIFFMLFIRPTPGYRLPRIATSISDILCYCHSSRILDDLSNDGTPIFSCHDATEDRIHLQSRIHLAKKEYQFGLYRGNDEKMHMGFDVSERHDKEGDLEYITEIDPGSTLYWLPISFFIRRKDGSKRHWYPLFWYWRKPSILQTKG